MEHTHPLKIPPYLLSWKSEINPLNAELNPIRHLLALVGARHVVHVSRIRVNIFPVNPYSFLYDYKSMANVLKTIMLVQILSVQ